MSCGIKIGMLKSAKRERQRDEVGELVFRDSSLP